MKKLLRLLVVLGVLAAVGLGWFRQSVHYALLEIGRAGQAGDVATLEKHVDIASLVDSVGDFTAEVAKAEAKGLAGDNLLGDLLGGLAGVVAGEVVQAAKPELEMKVRRRLAQGDVLDAFGPFKPYPGFEAIGMVRDAGPKKTVVMIAGTCYEEPASVNVVFERVPGPLGLDLLGTWRATGVEAGTLLILAETCREAAKKRQSSSSITIK